MNLSGGIVDELGSCINAGTCSLNAGTTIWNAHVFCVNAGTCCMNAEDECWMRDACILNAGGTILNAGA